MDATENLPLTGRTPRVLELGSGVSAAYAAKLLGDDGAEVIKVEESDGDATRRRGPFPDDQVDPEKSGLFLALNVNKRGVRLDLRSAAGRQDLEPLIAWTDILVHNYPRLRADALGLNPNVLQPKHPDLVVLSITPFGIAGPYRDYRATELIVANAGGWAGLCPATHSEIDLPPLKVFGHQCAMMTATAGALAALAALRDARRSGIGEHIDLSEQAYVAGVLEAAIPAYAYRDLVLKRTHRRSLIPWKMFQTKDVPIFLMCAEPDQWERLVDFMGRPDWAQLEVFTDLEGRAENQDMVHQFVQEFVGQWNALDFYHAAQKHRICVAPIQQYADLAADKHLRAREFFASVDQPDTGPVEHLASPVMTTAGRPPIRRRAPRLGEHSGIVDALEARPVSEKTGKPGPPLEGVRVVDLTWVWAGTFGAMNLAHLGAEVIRLESVERADMYRRLGPRPNNAPPDLDCSGMFNQWNQGKKSVAVDLGSPRGIDLAKEFVRVSDVVMQNFGTGVMERLGLDYEVLRQVNPRIILASISGYGQSGPHRNYIGYGPSISPLDGISAVTGHIGGGPEEVGVSMPDPNAGITAALAVVSALARRDQTGSGDHLDISLLESSAVFGVEAWMQYAFNGTQPERSGNRDPWMAPHGCFPCLGDDEWVALACEGDAEWRVFADMIQSELAADARFASLASRKENEDELEDIVAAWTGDRDRWQVTSQLQAAGIAAFPTFTSRDIVEDPHLNARGTIERLPHVRVGARPHTGVPWRFSRRDNGVRFPAPCLGADTEALLAEVLGYDDEKIAELRASKVLR